MTNDFEDRLRASLARHAEQAPPAGLLAERIVHATARTDGVPAPRRWGWRTFALPLLAAGAVGAVVGGAFAVQSLTSHTASPPGPTAGHSAPAVSQGVTPTPVPSPTSIATTDLHDVRVVDLTFAGTDDGWALASADCETKPGRCTAFLRTTDGKTWKSMGGPAFNVAGVDDCAAPCVTGMRFATDSIGYAYGPSAFFMTMDGGLHWTRERGGAVAVESLNGNVIRVTATSTGCPGPCGLQVETARIGSTAWTPAVLPGSQPGFGVQLSRGGDTAYLLFPINWAGAGPDVTALYRSSDEGHTWQRGDEPCPQTGGPAVAFAVAAAPQGRVSVLCGPRDEQRFFVATSTDGGAHFAAQAGAIPPQAGGFALTGDPTTVLVVGGKGLAVSTNGGASWTTPAQPTGTVTWLGFESNTVGRVVTDNRTIWTTRNAGTTWTAVTLP